MTSSVMEKLQIIGKLSPLKFTLGQLEGGVYTCSRVNACIHTRTRFLSTLSQKLARKTFEE